MTYNILHHNVDLNSSDFFQLRSNSITRGHNFKIFKPHVGDTILRYSSPMLKHLSEAIISLPELL